LDAEGKLIHQINDADKGDWHTIKVEDGYTFIGFQSTESANNLHAIGF